MWKLQRLASKTCYAGHFARLPVWNGIIHWTEIWTFYRVNRNPDICYLLIKKFSLTENFYLWMEFFGNYFKTFFYTCLDHMQRFIKIVVLVFEKSCHRTQRDIHLLLLGSYNLDNLGTQCARSIEDIVRCFEVSGWWRRKDESSRVLFAVVGALCAGRRFALWRQPHKQPTIEWARPPTFKCKAHSSSQNQLFSVLHYTTQRSTRFILCFFVNV